MRRDRGLVLLWAVLFTLLMALLLDALARRAWFAGREAEARAAREEALHEARGALRRRAARLSRGEGEGTRLEASAGGARVSALWQGGRLTDWEED